MSVGCMNTTFPLITPSGGEEGKLLRDSKHEKEDALKQKLDRKKMTIGIVSVLVGEVLFGFSYLFTKDITTDISPLALLSWRFVFAFIIMSLCIKARWFQINLKEKGLRELLPLMLISPIIYFLGETYGIAYTTASESGMMLAAIPIAAIIASAVVLKERPTRLQIIGIGITVSGVVAVVLVKGLQTSFHIGGYVILLIAIISYSLFSVFIQKNVRHTAVEKTYVMIGAGAAAFSIAALIESGLQNNIREFATLPFVNPKFFIAVLYLGILCSICGFALYNIAISYIGTNRSASFVGISTLTAVLAGVFILREQILTAQIVGMLLILIGVYIANKGYGYSKKSRKQSKKSK